jgi:hypothetical protein
MQKLKKAAGITPKPKRVGRKPVRKAGVTPERSARAKPKRSVQRSTPKAKPSATRIFGMSRSIASRHLSSDIRKRDAKAKRKSASGPPLRAYDMSGAEKKAVDKNLKSKTNLGKFCRMKPSEIKQILIDYGLQHKVDIKNMVNKDTMKADPNKLCMLLPKMFTAQGTENYAFVKHLGDGSFGQVYEARNLTTGKHVAVKLIAIDDNVSVRREVAMQKKFAKIKCAPDVEFYTSMTLKNSRKGQTLHLVFMQKVTGILEDYLNTKRSEGQLMHLVAQLSLLFSRIEAYKLTHGDAHPGNIAYSSLSTGNANIKFLDFGMSTDQTVSHKMDIIQFYRCLHRDYQPEMNEFNRSYLQKAIRELAFRKYKFTMPKTQEGVEDAWAKAHSIYKKKYCK